MQCQWGCPGNSVLDWPLLRPSSLSALWESLGPGSIHTVPQGLRSGALTPLLPYFLLLQERQTNRSFFNSGVFLLIIAGSRQLLKIKANMDKLTRLQNLTEFFQQGPLI